MNVFRAYLGWALLAACVASGCQKGEPAAGLDVRPVHPVKGKVTVGGKPATGALISFRAIAGASPYNPRATVEPDGSYTISTYRQHDGAPAGEYLVTIYWPVERPKRKVGEDDDPGINLPDRLGGKYSNPETTTLRATVSSGENSVDFKLP